jgi:hypothetical protein
MNKFIIILLTLVLFGCEQSKERNINNIVVHSVNLNIDTSIDVECKDFELTFNKEIKVYSIKAKSTLSELEILLQKTTKSNESKSLNVRRKIIVFYKNNSIDTLCVDRFNIVINNQMINKNDDLLNFVLNL